MSDAEETRAAAARRERIFLVVVDASAEMPVALRYACYRARNTGGRVALLLVMDPADAAPADMSQWLSIQDIMREERRGEAEQLLQRLAGEVNRMTGTFPILHLREGKPAEELPALLKEEKEISILVLAAGTGPEGPGPLVTALTGKAAGKLPIPVTIVPGNLGEEQLRLIT